MAFHAWAEHETALHVERLWAFAHRRSVGVRFKAAADALAEELRRVSPEAFDRRYRACDAGPSPALRRLEPRDDIALGDMTGSDWLSFVIKAIVLLALYGGYRLVRTPVEAGSSFALDDVALRPFWQVILAVYGHLHVLLTFAFLGWLYFRRHSAFGFVRNILVLAAGIGAVPYVVFSLATYHDGHDVAVPAVAIPTMPAMHLAAAIIVGTTGYLLTSKRRSRLLWLGWPAMVVLLLVVSRPARLVETVLFAIGAATVAWTACALAAPRLRRRRWFSSRQPRALRFAKRLSHSSLARRARALKRALFDTAGQYEPGARSR